MNNKTISLSLITSLVLLTLAGCSSSSSSETTVDTSIDSSIDNATILTLDIIKFDSTALKSYEEVDCTLTNGETTKCYEVTISGFPSDREEVGPFCPTTTYTDAESAGKWFNDGVLYDLTGEFVKNLASFYGDSNWKLYDETEEIIITTTQAACEAAARPDVDEAYQNHCVQCDISYYKDADGKGLSSTYLIPKTPVVSTSDSAIGSDGVGISLNGVKLEAAAPVEAILGAYTIAAFDDCVGHVNPFEGYHYHGANQGDGNCPSVPYENDGHGGIFGYALDGFAIYSMLDEDGNEPTDLDSCRGHSDDIRGYHYHTADAGENAFIGCFRGALAQ